MAANRGPEIEQIFNFLTKQFPNKDPEAILELATSKTRSGIAGDAAANTKLIEKEAEIRKRYAGIKQIYKGAALAEQVANEKREIEDLRRSSQGIGGLDTSDPLPNVKVLGSRPAS